MGTASGGAADERAHIRRKSVLCSPQLQQSVVWSVQDGAEVDAGQLLGTAGLIELGNLRRLTAPCRGTFHVVTKDQAKTCKQPAIGQQDAGSETSASERQREDGAGGSEMEAGSLSVSPSEAEASAAEEDPLWVIAEVEYCIHPVRNGRVCLMCLAAVDDEEEEEGMDDERRSVNVVSHGQVIRLNLEEAKKFDSENIKRQLAAKKLSLVLDLDHTLLHAVRVDDVVGEVTKTDDMHFFFIPGLPQQHVVKLRPGLDTFLKEASRIYDLFIYTHGTRLYAEQIAKIIDPDDSYFHHRIVARTDTPDMVHKSLKLLFPSCDDSMIMVLDDRIDVWKENEGSVFLIEPYHFFKCTVEINNASGNGALGIEADDSDSTVDNHLQHTLAVLKNVHEEFFEGYDSGMTGRSADDQLAGNGRDVKAILSNQKRTVLQGCNIVFSGVFPIVGARSHESHYLWRLAVELGAVPSMVMQDFPITHLVIHPERLGTQKHVQAKAISGVFVVTPEWLFKCARTWSRAPETDFLADEWKLKHAPPAVPTTDAPNVPQGGAVANGSTAAVELTVSKAVSDGVIGQATLAEAVAQAKPVVGILVTPSDDSSPDTTKPKKQVKFAENIDDDKSPSRRKKLLHRNLVNRPLPSGVRRSAPPRTLPTGTVASGGTFDFLSKISKIHESRKDVKPSAPTGLKQIIDDQESKKAVKFAVPEPKDVDDAFLRLIEAEEREDAQAQKRKIDSTDIKDQLATRRQKVLKAVPLVATVENMDDDDGDDDDAAELDDLEADILGDL